MNFTVLWRRRAETGFVRLWARAADPQQVLEAADVVNRLLRDSAHELGESRERATRRLWFQRPLCVAYEIDEAAKIVYVAAVQWVGF